MYENLKDLCQDYLNCASNLQFLKKTRLGKNEEINLYDKGNLFNVEIMNVRFLVEDESNNLNEYHLLSPIYRQNFKMLQFQRKIVQ